MKKLCSIVTVLFMLLSFNTIGYAAENKTVYEENEYVEYFSDGSYIVTTIEEIASPLSATKTATAPKTSKYYNSKNELEWTVTVTGTFNYDGKTASCTKAVTSYKIYNDRWEVTDANASKKGAKAIGDFTVKRYWLGIPTTTVNKTVTLTCSKDGKIS